MTHPEPPQAAEIARLVERLQAYRSYNEWGDPCHHTICDEAADMLTRLASVEPDNARLRGALELCAGQLDVIRSANDPDDPESYRSDDREGCLDWTFAAADLAHVAARHALAPSTDLQTPAPAFNETGGSYKVGGRDGLR